MYHHHKVYGVVLVRIELAVGEVGNLACQRTRIGAKLRYVGIYHAVDVSAVVRHVVG